MLKNKSFLFRLTDAFLILMTLLPMAAGIVLQVLTKPAADGIEITGARIFSQ